MNPRATLETYEQRLNLHDFDAVADLIAEDAVFWFSDGSHRGRADIRAAFERTWRALADETYWLDQLEWLAEGHQVAACAYHFNWKARIGGEAASGTGRGTTVLSQARGRWQIVHEHLSHRPG
jgi:ketosteroid isomerase-like protein